MDRLSHLPNSLLSLRNWVVLPVFCLGGWLFIAHQCVALAAPVPELIARVESKQRPHGTKAKSQPSLCTNGEQVVFSCQIKTSRKMLSLCSAKNSPDDHNSLRYRFGRPGQVELVYPKPGASVTNAFRYRRYTRPLVTYLTVIFETGGYRYEIHQNFNQEEKPSVNEAFVSVLPLGTASGVTATPTELHCHQSTQGSLMKLEDLGFVPEEEAREP